jgi:hypothetical protein
VTRKQIGYRPGGKLGRASRQEHADGNFDDDCAYLLPQI